MQRNPILLPDDLEHKFLTLRDQLREGAKTAAAQTASGMQERYYQFASEEEQREHEVVRTLGQPLHVQLPDGGILDLNQAHHHPDVHWYICRTGLTVLNHVENILGISDETLSDPDDHGGMQHVSEDPQADQQRRLERLAAYALYPKAFPFDLPESFFGGNTVNTLLRSFFRNNQNMLQKYYHAIGGKNLVEATGVLAQQAARSVTFDAEMVERDIAAAVGTPGRSTAGMR